MTRIGVCGLKFPEAAELGPEGVLSAAAELGHHGVFFRTILHMSPELDPGRLAALRQQADDLDLYLETGLGKVNPFNTAEDPSIRELGDGDYLLGARRVIEAAAAIGCADLWGDTANYQHFRWGLHAIDRFRTDVTWEEQLEATRRLLHRLAPVLRGHGARINLETHEEITTFELVRLVEDVGPDAVGVTLDLANVVVRGEDPVEATRRVAPYTRQTHMRDLVVTFTGDGLERQNRACGDGVVDLAAVLSLLLEHAPQVNLTIENTKGRDRNGIQIFDRRWQDLHPDLPLADLAGLVRLASVAERRMAAGELTPVDSYYAPPLGAEWERAFLRRSADHLTTLLSRLT
ncbi:sugar phosphate isomerase/epimerase [Streptosporangium sandarakinum]|uniref:Sugar phosphate isomerase/epimerase n=1 Tax=Streptosporangium sandarakinum TaxID=1260955 RepID=A0A852V1T2_9ACTN|nr:sugar phosphate isomerase/epimerase [Streptosporangium sandarakinum]NYF43722.1 sugar phosphate isomerase/epimerase [Streptosporangium sandarakinum]